MGAGPHHQKVVEALIVIVRMDVTQMLIERIVKMLATVGGIHTRNDVFVKVVLE